MQAFLLKPSLTWSDLADYSVDNYFHTDLSPPPMYNLNNQTKNLNLVGFLFLKGFVKAAVILNLKSFRC